MKSKEKSKRVIRSIALEKEFSDEVKELANIMGWSVSAFVEEALQQFINNNRKSFRARIKRLSLEVEK